MKILLASLLSSHAKIFLLPISIVLLIACMCRLGTGKLNLVVTYFQATSDLLVDSEHGFVYCWNR